jgi:hypothetical protein
VTMSNSAFNYIRGVSGTDTLTNQETIQGAGQIGFGQMKLVNSGIITANQSAGILIQASGGFTNSGTLTVGSGDLRRVFGERSPTSAAAFSRAVPAIQRQP